MYPGTWNFDFSSNQCTSVHGILIFFHCVARGWRWTGAMIGQLEKSEIEIEIEYQLTGHPVFESKLPVFAVKTFSTPNLADLISVS